MEQPLAKRFPQLTNEQRAERDALIEARNLDYRDIVVAVTLEFAGLADWEQLSKSKAAVASRIAEAIHSVYTAPNDVLNKATCTVIQEIYAIEEWPTTMRVVESRVTAAISRLGSEGAREPLKALPETLKKSILEESKLVKRMALVWFVLALLLVPSLVLVNAYKDIQLSQTAGLTAVLGVMTVFNAIAGVLLSLISLLLLILLVFRTR